MTLSANVAGFQFCFANVMCLICLTSFVSAVLRMSQVQVFSIAKRAEQTIFWCEWRFSYNVSVAEMIRKAPNTMRITMQEKWKNSSPYKYAYTIHACVVDTSVSSGAVLLVIGEEAQNRWGDGMKENRRRKKSLFPSLQLVFPLSHLPVKAEGSGVTPRDAVSLWTLQNFQTQSEKSTKSASSPRGAAGSVCRLHRESLSPTFCLIDWTSEE